MTSNASIQEEPIPPRGLVSLQGVATLAHVQRPVVSMWRRRFRTGTNTFPRPVRTVANRLLFDEDEVAQWLEATGHGNNPDARADAASAATPADLSFAVDADVAELEALIALQGQTGALSGRTATVLREDAGRTDPDDLTIRSEVEQHIRSGRDWRAFVDRIVDAAYSPAGALDVVAQRSRAAATSSGSDAPLGVEATDLLGAFVRAWPQRPLLLGAGIDADLGTQLAAQTHDDTDLTLAPGPQSRRLRRRLQVLGRWLADAEPRPGVLRIDRIPHRTGDTDEAALTIVDDLALQLHADDIAVVLGPARLLTDALPAAAGGVRADVLRTDHVRAIVRLPVRLVPGATREALAVWVLGSAPLHLPAEDRYTAVADLTDTTLTPAHRVDLISDVIASMGPADQLHARAYRFLTRQRTSSLRARRGSLTTPRPARHRTPNAVELVARLESAQRDLGDDLPPIVIAEQDGETASPPAPLTDLVRDRHARLIPGTRLSTEHSGDAGLRVIRSHHLDNPALIGKERVDPLAFAATHPSAPLTQPGDVVFRTGPTTAAWVDHDGSSVVAYPARILRIRRTDPGGLVPELVAEDIAEQPAGPGAWKRWHLRRVPPTAVPALRDALAKIRTVQADLTARLTRLDTYTNALVTGTAAGAITLTIGRTDSTTVTAPES
jgi:predicted DNA-binding transcriptional regulator AlpA